MGRPLARIPRGTIVISFAHEHDQRAASLHRDIAGAKVTILLSFFQRQCVLYMHTHTSPVPNSVISTVAGVCNYTYFPTLFFVSHTAMYSNHDVVQLKRGLLANAQSPEPTT